MFNFLKRKVSIADSGILKGMTDYHSHLLPGVDDGVKTKAETLKILEEMEKQGIRKVWFTPHIMEDIPNKTADLKKKFAEVQVAYQGNIVLHLAAENMLDNLFEVRLEKDDLLPIEKDGKRYLLVETSYFNPPMDLYDILKQIQQKGYYPLLAHPERYEYMTMKDYKALKDANVVFQLNLPALGGMYGKGVQQKAGTLLKAGAYDRIGCDILFFDLPGTVNSPGVIKTIVNMDYVFTPIIQDRMVMQSSLSFLLALKDFMQQNPDMPLKEIRMFWNRMDGRVSKRLFHQYGLLFKELGLKVLDTVIPDMERYGRETSPEERILFRSTLFPPSGKLLKGSALDTLAGEIEGIIHPDRQKA